MLGMGRSDLLDTCQIIYSTTARETDIVWKNLTCGVQADLYLLLSVI